MAYGDDVSGLTVLLERELLDWHPGNYDGNKVFLTSNGGAMASVIALAGFKPLQDRGLLERVDGFAGDSGGGLNCAYAAAGQIDEGLDVYARRLPDASFLDLSPKGLFRIITSRLIYAERDALERLDVLEDIMSVGAARLDTERLKKLDVPVLATVTSAPDFQSHTVDLRKLDGEDIVHTLVRGGAIPFISGNTDQTLPFVDGVCLDGSMAIGVTEELALAHEPTHIVSIASSPYKSLKSGLLERMARRGFRYALAKRVFTGEGFHKRHMQLGYRQEELLRKFKMNGFYIDGTRIDKIYPDPSPKLPERTCMDKEKLKAGITAGILAMQTALAQAEATFS